MPICQGFSHFKLKKNFFVLTKLATSSTRVKQKIVTRTKKIILLNQSKGNIIKPHYEIKTDCSLSPTGLNGSGTRCSLAIFIKSFSRKHFFLKIFEGEMLIRTQQTTHIQILCKMILNFQVIVKSIINPDDNFKKDPCTLIQ